MRCIIARSLDAQSLRGSLAFTGELGTACEDWRKASLLDPRHLEQKGTALDNRSLSLGLRNTSPFVFPFFFKSLQLCYRHELSDRVSAARPRRQGHIYAAQISTGQWIRFDTRYLKYRGGDPLLSLVLSLAAPRPLR